ncbi:LOB domain-containing protein 29-like isoform X2 [Asparagus officinalis]|uniref:LOB domain-containing protein 29-like isoform X2 n=1 Tax=Asparagus officinalis TaxID=4686 RepID=UPI00098E1355|nr:LOB domain-containing protein 29-like isoform X2 [Asparagus officinalis]
MVGVGSSCGACKFLRRKLHKIFGASNVSKLLSKLPIYNRSAAAITISFEAQARIQDPVRGCLSHILALQYQVACLQEEIESLMVKMVPRSCSLGTVDEFKPRMQEVEPGYKEVINRLEDCLLNANDEPNSWEELALYLNDLEKDLMH